MVRGGTLTLLSYLALFGSFGAWTIAAGFVLVAMLMGFGVIKPPSLADGMVGFELLPTPLPTFTPTPSPTPTPPPPDIAIIAGHWSKADPQGVTTIHDTGAICDDGLREVTINKAVADKVVALLQARGYRVDLLEEFDPRLKQDNPDYAPSVLLSIHTDSCVHGLDYPLATGYKIAHAEPSNNPGEDDRLVACLRRDYDAAVKPYNLTFNENTITPDMTEYHAFREIVTTTPAAIIELGFMYNDRAILLGHQDELARGLADGLEAFLKKDRCGLNEATPTPEQ
jgi:N-acetylmuramoyl-L-alanine amidase